MPNKNESYEKIVNIGNEDINVSYTDYSHIINNFKSIKFNLWDRITIPFYRLRSWYKHRKSEIKWAYQRVVRDYDDPDWFELYSNFINRYSKILTEFKNSNQSVPMEFEAKPEEWTATIDKMLYHLKLMDENYVVKTLSKDMPEHYAPDIKVVWDIMERHKNEFFILFSKYFYNLWD